MNGGRKKKMEIRRQERSWEGKREKINVSEKLFGVVL
jgi:hypothetical protein